MRDSSGTPPPVVGPCSRGFRPRRDGLLVRAWPFFEAMFGPYVVEGPHSLAMRTFLGKRAHHVVLTRDGQEVRLYGGPPDAPESAGR